MKSSLFIKFILLFYLISKTLSIIEYQDTKDPQQEFRGVWVSPAGGDRELITYISEEQFKQNMTYILDTLKFYKINSLIYHVRLSNKAFYPSELNPVSDYFKNVNFTQFDPVKWMIDETHKRGIDFHAWMNPYVIIRSTLKELDDILKEYQNYTKNPASDKDCILKCVNFYILNPGLERVRTFIVDTIMEFLNKYNVEAIHFDDFFYDDMGAYSSKDKNFTILNESDQSTYENYIDSHPECKYDKNNVSDKADWRREQVDTLIFSIKQKINEYNKKNKKYVQFGISPSGVYKSGDGNVEYDENMNAITNGSNTTTTFEHYSSYLFADTVKWCNEGWLDYLLPQSYWATNHPTAGFYNIMVWWDKVLKYKKVNLYSGLGLYMSDEDGNTYNWKTDYNEFYNQLKYVTDSEITLGASIYNFATLRNYKDGKKEMISYNQIENAIKLWSNILPPSEIKSFEKIELEHPTNITVEKNYILKFDKVENAKFYVIYKSKEKIKFIPDQIVDIIGNPENNERIEWKDINKDEKSYKYDVRALSYSNTLGKYPVIPPDVDISRINIVSLITLFSLLILLI